MSRDINNKFWDEELETLPREELEKRQLADLQEIVKFAYENGDFTLNHRPKEFSDVSAYLRRQSRFKHLTDEDIEIITRSRDKKWEFINQNFKLF